jgi:alkylation response protein AidB-like acyl-CoA dehydrogenase
MSERQNITINSGGQWLVSPVANTTVFCRETFSEDHRDIDEMIQEFAKDRILPNAEAIDTLNKDLTLELLREMGELGLIGVDSPEEYGGTDLDKITSCIVAEGMSRGGSPSFGCTFAVQTGIGSMGIVFFGTPEQKEKYLPKLMTGEWVAAYALTEPSAGSDALAGKTTAVLSEDGKHYILNGEKQFISNGSWADVFTVLAQVDGDKFSGFIVDKDTEGFEIGAEEKKMGMKGSSTTSLKFTDAKVPVENLLYDVGKGAAIAFNALNIGRYKLAASCIGGSKLGIEKAIEYALERRQFGQPIANFDAIHGKIADMVVRIYAADAMLYRTVGLIQDAIDELDKTSPDYYKKMGEATERFAVEASMAKVFGSESSDMVVDGCLQILGGYGFTEEYPMARAYRDDRINRIWEGTNEINRAIITGYMMKKVLMEEISLRDFLRDLDSFLEEAIPDIAEDQFQSEKNGLDAAKRLASLVFQEALCEYGQDLKHEQQLSEALADMFNLIFTSGSVISRATQAQNLNGTSNMSSAIARIFAAESLHEIKTLANVCLNKIFKETIPTELKESVMALEDRMTLNTDTISLKQDLADFMTTQKTYPF